MILTDLIKSKRFYINLSIAIIVIFLVFFTTIIGIDIYTDQGHEIDIPDLKGMSIEEAEDVLKDKSLTVEIIDSVYSTNLEKGSIIEQAPKTNNKIKENRTIYVTVVAFSKEMVSMPDLVNASIRQAITDASSFGIKIGERKYIPGLKDYVLKQIYRGNQIKVGTKIPKGTYIDLEIGQGTNNEQIPVPNVLGMKLPEANSKCSNSFISISGIFYDDKVLTKKDSLNSVIYKQSPMPIDNNKIVLGSFIDVWMSTNKSLVPEIEIDTISNTNDIDAENIL